MRKLILATVLLAACSSNSNAPSATPPPSAVDFKALVDDPSRDAADRALDAGRRPAEFLAFADVRPGMRVADLGAGGGYTTELLVRAVGPTGKVYAQNSPTLLKMFLEKFWALRLQKPIMKNVVRVDRELDDPLPPDAKDLDRVVMFIFYHDAVWLKNDRAKMDRAIFNALKPGGSFIIVDHNAAPGHGVADAESLHRIEESVVRDEVVKAGFKAPESADFLRSPQDTRDWNASPRTAGEKRGTSDRFVLKFVKP